jgi:hypothetical protein
VSQSVKGVRDLRKLIPRSTINWNAEVAQTTATGGWEILGTGAFQFAVYRTYIDIVGWSKDDITAFTQGAAFQEGGSIYYSPQGARPLQCWDILSVNYIADDQFSDNLDALGLNWCPPGLSNSNYNLEEILAGRWREFATSQDLATSRLIGQGVWGAGDATAGDRIHITKVFFLDSAFSTDGILIIPDGAVVVPTLLVKEPDLVYMERLRRSYVLQENR